MSVPPFQPQYEQSQYAQPQYAPQPSYGPSLSPSDAPVPMRTPSPGPTGVPHGVPSSQYPPATGAPFEPPAQTRGPNPVGRNPRSHGRQPPVSQQQQQQMNAPGSKHRDWRFHPHFKRSRCTGGRKALCVSLSASALLTDTEQGYR